MRSGNLADHYKEDLKMEHITLNNGAKIPQLGIGTFKLSPQEAEASVEGQE